jgi:hypothetical protein
MSDFENIVLSYKFNYYGVYFYIYESNQALFILTTCIYIIVKGEIFVPNFY